MILRTNKIYKVKVVKITDYGCFSLESVDYPDFAHKLAESIEKGENEMGVQFCGTGNGINMSANKHQGIRAALCWNAHIAEQARLHNNANILALPGRQIDVDQAKNCFKIFIGTSFDGGRHQKRVEKID